MVQIQVYEGSRDVLDPLFAEADDSESQIAGYKNLGEILVAVVDGNIVGQVLIAETDDPRTFEIKSLAVDESWRSRGIGAALVQAACAYCRQRRVSSVLVATAAASIPALKFYQRQGFRIRHVIRDFYSPERGYRPLELDGIPLLDEVILDRDLGSLSAASV
ncbi:GNAT family N-acetyltransferase [Sphingomonas sp.]|uniref:GNAT family N-acetyltransferase n=1 Tax=Sphingomonas sp. TaxID=28214 RepID=UPI0025F6B4EA|nr:GNAT family N-acetyltransferase [Sphingomonas sp.]